MINSVEKFSLASVISKFWILLIWNLLTSNDAKLPVNEVWLRIPRLYTAIAAPINACFSFWFNTAPYKKREKKIKENIKMNERMKEDDNEIDETDTESNESSQDSDMDED